MDMNLREWLVVLGGIVIAGIVLDGIRRMRRARRDSMEISLGMGGEIENTPLDEGFNPELPNGGARLAGGANLDNRREINSVDETDSVSVIDADLRVDANPRVDTQARIEPSIQMGSFDNSQLDDESVSAARVVARDAKVSLPDEPAEVPLERKLSNDAGEIRATKADNSSGRVSRDEKKAKSKMTFGEGLKASSSKAKPATAKSKRTTSNTPPKPAQEVIILNVMCKSAEGFKGNELKTLLEACGVEHGDMSIFHRHENTMDSPVQFSVANAVEPGYFPKDQLDSMATPGISFFMSLPGPDDNMRAFDYMVETAQCVVRNLSGEMKDERRSDMTPQTLEHCRQRIRDFERRQLAAKC